MPPASPAPGWSSGLVCTDRVATRRGVADRRKRRAGTRDLPLLLRPSCGCTGGTTHPCRLSILQQRQDGHMPGPSIAQPHGRVAVVTGASSGIGAATAERLAAEGFSVVLGARRMDRLSALAERTGGRALPLDVTDDASVAAFAAELDRVDVLVNNAGGAFDARPVAEADVDAWQRAFDVNVLGTVRMTKAL